MGNSVTMKDVALASDVSVATVSYILNGKADEEGIAPATRQRVLAVAAQLGYKPNTVAREMALGRLSASGQLLSYQVIELLGEHPAGQPVTTQQLSNLTTLLGYRLVPVATAAELGRLSAEGLVGVLYKPASFVPMSGTTAATEGRGESEAPVVTGACPEPVEGVPGGTVTGRREDAADTAATIEEREREAPVVTAVPAVESGAANPVPTPVMPPPEVAVPVEDNPVTVVDDAADTAATTEERESEAPVVTDVPGGTVSGSVEPVPTQVVPSPEVAVPVEVTPVTVVDGAAGTAATTEEGSAAAPVVTAVPAVGSLGAKDAADTAATTEEGESEAPVVTAVPAVGTVEGLGDAEESTAPDVTDDAPEAGEAVPGGTDPESVEPVTNPVESPEGVELGGTTPVTVQEDAAGTLLRQGSEGQAPATTEEGSAVAPVEPDESAEAPVVTAVPAVETGSAKPVPTPVSPPPEVAAPVEVTPAPAVASAADTAATTEESAAAPVEPDESAEAPVVTAVPAVETGSAEPVPTPVMPPPEVAVPVEVTPVTVVDSAAGTAATTEESAAAPGITAAPGDDEAPSTTQQPDNPTTR